MKNFTSYLIATAFTMTMQPVFAEKIKPLHGCNKVGFKYENRLVILEPQSISGRQTIYLIHNTTHNIINLELHPNPEAYLFYKNQIAAEEWGAFAMDEKQLTFTCKSTGKNSAVLDCEKVLNICQFTDTKFPEGNNGDYWAIASQPLEKTRKDIIGQGILLR